MLKKLYKLDWSKILSTDAYVFENTRPPKKFFHARQIAKLFLIRPDIPCHGSTEYLCFRSLDRDDYKQLFECVTETINRKKILIQDFRKRQKFVNANTALNLFLNFPLLAKFGKWDLRTRLYLYFKVAFYTTVLKKISNLQFEKLLVFADMQPLDNLLVQYFTDIPSITLQHGLYVDYKSTVTINNANYAHQISRYFLAWGKDTASLISRHHPNTRIYICGKPNLITVNSDSTLQGQKYFAVVFDQNMFESYNFQLLNIAYQYSDLTGLKFVLKFHPWNYQPKYDVRPQYLSEHQNLKHAQFVIGHTTSLIYEYLRLGIPSYKLRSVEHALETPDKIQFRDAHELHELTLKMVAHDELVAIGKEYIEFIGTESKELYRSFFSNLDNSIKH